MLAGLPRRYDVNASLRGVLHRRQRPTLDLNTDGISKLMGGLVEYLRGGTDRDYVDRERQYSKLRNQAAQFRPMLQVGADNISSTSDPRTHSIAVEMMSAR